MIDADVLVVGGGPTGLALANALGQRGARVVLAERDPGPATLPRAVSIDDEALRFMQALDLLEGVSRIAVPGTGTRFYGANGKPLAYARGATGSPLGYPPKNPIDHPEFQTVLLDGLSRHHVDVRFETELTRLADLGDHVLAETDGGRGRETMRVRFVLACDGGRSTVRTELGIDMLGASHPERWLVIDTLDDPHDQRYAMHHGDPRRPYVIVPGRDRRCRYEFLLLPGEEPLHDHAALELARALVRPHRGELRDEHVVRCTVYTFHALVAERWRAGRVLLLGDAAHMMPPFAGQGLNSGLRDAANLGWKVGAVLRDQAGLELLESYERERRPHVEAMIQLSVRMGRVMMTTSRSRARTRDAIIRTGRRLPAIRRYLGEMRYKPAPRHAEGLRFGDSPLAGSMLPQPTVLMPSGAQVALDGVLGQGFALVAVDPPGNPEAALADPLWRELRAQRLALRLGDRQPPRWAGVRCVSDAQGSLDALLDAERGRVLVVRPDRFVLGSFALGEERAAAASVRELLGRRERAATA